MKTTHVVVVTGLSGAGKSTALHALEDLGFFCIDNLPTPVVEATLAACTKGGLRRLGFGIDVRVRAFLDDVGRVLDALPVAGERDLAVLFLDASDEALLRRFSSTRRPHPLSTTLEPGSEQAATAVLDGIRYERERLAPLRARASEIVDTTALSVHDLRRRILASFGPGVGERPRMLTRIVSFGFKYGTPVDADLVFDVRFLQNPYFVDALRDLPGTDDRVSGFVLGQEETKTFVGHVRGMLEYCLPRFEKEGKSYLTVAVGCTGGRHRSVAISEHLSEVLEESTGLSIDVVHRDVERSGGERKTDPDLMGSGSQIGGGR